MASLLFRNILRRNIINSSLGLYSSVTCNLSRKLLSCTVTTYTSNKNAWPAHQEVIENKEQKDREFTKETIDLVNNQIKEEKEGRLFAVIHVAGKQFKITPEDIIIIHGHWPPQPSDEIQFEKVLLVGGRDFTLVGRPVLPSNLVKVKGTIVEKDLSHTKTHFVKRRRKQYQRINFIRSEHTMVRINEITVAPTIGESGDSEPVNRVNQ